MTARKPPTCAACGELLTTAPRGHGKRFCGAACRVAAYRRRQQKVSEKMPRWEHARGRLRLSKARAFDQRQGEVARWRRETEQQRQRTERAIAAAKAPVRAPLADDWMYRR